MSVSILLELIINNNMGAVFRFTVFKKMEKYLIILLMNLTVYINQIYNVTEI